MKITIVTVTYNCESEVEATIQSVLSQDYPNIEYIVVDGASKDGTVEIINRYRDRITKIISEPDKGLYEAMNKALMIATGTWCNFLNAGDKYTDNHTVSAMIEGLRDDKKKKVLYGNTEYIHQDGHRTMHKTAPIERLKWTISRYQPYTHQAVFYNIERKEDCIYDLRYRIAADYDVACRYWRRYGIEAYCLVPITVCSYKAYDGVSSNPKNINIMQKERLLIKIRNRMNIIEIAKDTVRYLCNSYK